MEDMGFNKQHFIEQLAGRLKQSDEVARRAGDEAREAARTLQTESEKKEDGRAAIEFGSLATGQSARARKVQEELQQLAAFVRGGVPSFQAKSPIGLGAVIDVAVDGDDGSQERTFILLPVGAGTELTGPGGDGFLSVITPASPVGRALIGRRAGDQIDVTIGSETREWTVVEVG
jgi:transcription elongation GreA/GreB family factor